MPLNPVAFTEQVVTDFLHYQLTTYPLADVARAHRDIESGQTVGKLVLVP